MMASRTGKTDAMLSAPSAAMVSAKGDLGRDDRLMWQCQSTIRRRSSPRPRRRGQCPIQFVPAANGRGFEDGHRWLASLIEAWRSSVVVDAVDVCGAEGDTNPRGCWWPPEPM
jgi:hypothetical protein